MAISNEEKEFVTYLLDIMQCIGPASARRMFGGHGIFLNGLMFALVADSTLYLKADKETENDFKERDLEAFTYYKKDKPYRLSYFRAPEEILENNDDMYVWANKAYQVALRSNTRKR